MGFGTQSGILWAQAPVLQPSCNRGWRQQIAVVDWRLRASVEKQHASNAGLAFSMLLNMASCTGPSPHWPPPSFVAVVVAAPHVPPKT